MSFFEFPHTRTYDGDLGWLIKHVSGYDEVITALNEWIETNTPRLEDLEAFMNALNNGELPEGVKKGIYDWCSINLIDLVASTLVAVSFEITQDGHFVAYYADSWDELTFNTTEYDIYIEDQPEYGHLVLSY